MDASFSQRHPVLKDVLSIIVFLVLVLLGTMFINSFVFRSYNVVGPSMESTMFTGDRLIVNRLPATWAQLQNEQYVPERGQVIVFKNPRFNADFGDEFIVKRVIAFPGERVVVNDGDVRVYNAEFPGGFDPDDANNGEPGVYTSGEVDTIVSKDTLFVMGDHREGSYSCDSRECMGTIPYYDVIGPVALRIYPFTELKAF